MYRKFCKYLFALKRMQQSSFTLVSISKHSIFCKIYFPQEIYPLYYTIFIIIQRCLVTLRNGLSSVKALISLLSRLYAALAGHKSRPVYLISSHPHTLSPSPESLDYIIMTSSLAQWTGVSTVVHCPRRGRGREKKKQLVVNQILYMLKRM